MMVPSTLSLIGGAWALSESLSEVMKVMNNRGLRMEVHS